MRASVRTLVLVLAVVVTAALWLSVTPANAHGWYGCSHYYHGYYSHHHYHHSHYGGCYDYYYHYRPYCGSHWHHYDRHHSYWYGRGCRRRCCW